MDQRGGRGNMVVGWGATISGRSGWIGAGGGGVDGGSDDDGACSDDGGCGDGRYTLCRCIRTTCRSSFHRISIAIPRNFGRSLSWSTVVGRPGSVAIHHWIRKEPTGMENDCASSLAQHSVRNASNQARFVHFQSLLPYCRCAKKWRVQAYLRGSFMPWIVPDIDRFDWGLSSSWRNDHSRLRTARQIGRACAAEEEGARQCHNVWRIAKE